MTASASVHCFLSQVTRYHSNILQGNHLLTCHSCNREFFLLTLAESTGIILVGSKTQLPYADAVKPTVLFTNAMQDRQPTEDEYSRAVPGAYRTGFWREYVLPISSSTFRL